jgi:nucleotidyltransferase/DNA polymerase involved in DNA repair
VGGGSRQGVVTTCNYEARKFGVHSAMPGFQAREKCPNLVFLPVRFDLYRAESVKIHHILLSYTPLVEPLSRDEAYLDVTGLDRYAWKLSCIGKKPLNKHSPRRYPLDRIQLPSALRYAGLVPNLLQQRSDL